MIKDMIRDRTKAMTRHTMTDIMMPMKEDMRKMGNMEVGMM
jgi:hypothetical protein